MQKSFTALFCNNIPADSFKQEVNNVEVWSIS